LTFAQLDVLDLIGRAAISHQLLFDLHLFHFELVVLLLLLVFFELMSSTNVMPRDLHVEERRYDARRREQNERGEQIQVDCLVQTKYVRRTRQVEFDVNEIVGCRENESDQEDDPHDLVYVRLEFFVVLGFANGHVSFDRQNDDYEQVHVE
jgi:hypothetical protein